MRVSIAIETKDRRPGGQVNYLGMTLQNMRRSGIFESPHFDRLRIVSGGEQADFYEEEVMPYTNAEFYSCREGCTRQQNGARAIRLGAADTNADLVLKLEDDLDFCADFLGSTVRWFSELKGIRMCSLGGSFEIVEDSRYLEEGETILGPGKSFDKARQMLSQGATTVYQPIMGFWGAQALLWPRDLAEQLALWFGDDPNYNGCRDRAHDLMFHRWGQESGVAFFAVPVPSFVQHIGRQSGLANPFFEFAWPGREWSYKGKGILR